MIILVTLNISNPHNVEADSGYIFTRTIIEDILNARPDWKFCLLGPSEAAFSHQRVIHIPVMLPCTKYQARFGFEWLEFAQAIKKYRPGPIDLVWVNQVEQAGNFTALVRQLEGRKVATFTYFHYPCVLSSGSQGLSFDPSLDDWQLGELILLRQYEAFACSSITGVGSLFARTLLLDSFRTISATVPKEKMIAIPPPIDFPVESSVAPPPPGIPIVIYNHRLYRHYGTERLIDWIEAFRSLSGKHFNLLVTDPLSNRSSEQDRLDPSVSASRERLRELSYASVVTPQSRKEYLMTLRATTVGLAPFRDAPPWSMASLDIMACGRPLLAPSSGPFPEILGGRESLLFRNFDDFCWKLDRLLRSRESWLEEANYCLARAQNFHRSVLIDRYIDLFEGIPRPTTTGEHSNGKDSL
jgi:glycosyltransferase involved in cell wall biosynthesis